MDNSTAGESEREGENINFTQYLSNIVWAWAQCRVAGGEGGMVQQCVASFIYLFLFFSFSFLLNVLFLFARLFVVGFSTHLSHLQF